MKNNKVAKIIMQIFWISLIVIFNMSIYMSKNYYQIYGADMPFIIGNKEKLVFLLFSILLVIYVIYYYNQNSTNYKKQELSIGSILIFNLLAILIFIYSFKTSLKSIMLFVFYIYLFILVFKLLGKFKAYLEIHKVNKDIKKTNPYIYYRELPNNYGIGIITLLVDSTLENEKDIVAVILDLCAKKYLSLVKNNDKYIIKVLKPVDDNLFVNEKYILNLIINNDLKSIDYKTWYKTCVNDGINLGLYTYEETKTNSVSALDKIANREDKVIKTIGVTSAIIGVIVALFGTLYWIKDNGVSTGNILISIIVFIGLFYACFFASLCILRVVCIVFNSFSFIFNSSKNLYIKNYKDIKDNRLIVTEKGKEELQKLYSFKAFIKDFGNFAPREAKEIVLWDRYLSYAQVFGLTKEIMQTGYNELVNNASFQIDNIDNINFDNIEILK